MMESSEVNFITKLEDPYFLLKGCKIYWTKYFSNVELIPYRIWSGFLKGEDRRPDKHLLLGLVKVMLLEWNWPYFKTRTNLVNELPQQLEKAYNESVKYLHVLEGIYLGSKYLFKYLDIIGEVYEIWREKPAIRDVGASKALHFIHPELFVPWDNRIAEYYHKETKHGKHDLKSKECYMIFMEKCNEIAQRLLENASRLCIDILRMHPIYIARRELPTIPKMIDECNFCWISKEERW